MNQSSHPSEANLHAIDYWQVIKNRYGVILLTFLLVFMTALVITYVMPKKYESKAVVQVRPKTGGGIVLPGLNDTSRLSLDNGQTWSNPVRVNAAPEVAAFVPTVHVLADNTLAVSYFDLRSNTSDPATLGADGWLARSRDGGLNFSETRLAGPFDLAIAPLGAVAGTAGYFIGDYMGLASSGDRTIAAFVQTTNTDLTNRWIVSQEFGYRITPGIVLSNTWGLDTYVSEFGRFANERPWRTATGNTSGSTMRTTTSGPGRPQPAWAIPSVAGFRRWAESARGSAKRRVRPPMVTPTVCSASP